MRGGRFAAGAEGGEQRTGALSSRGFFIKIMGAPQSSDWVLARINYVCSRARIDLIFISRTAHASRAVREIG